MIDEDEFSNSYDEHDQASTILGSEDIVEKIFNEPRLEDLLGECSAKIGFDLDLDKLLKQVESFNKLSLEDPSEECFAQFECDLDLDILCE